MVDAEHLSSVWEPRVCAGKKVPVGPAPSENRGPVGSLGGSTSHGFSHVVITLIAREIQRVLPCVPLQGRTRKRVPGFLPPDVTQVPFLFAGFASHPLTGVTHSQESDSGPSLHTPLADPAMWRWSWGAWTEEQLLAEGNASLS